MRESFLHFIWQFQKFDANLLISEDGQSIAICNTGIHNTGAGPDFEHAKVVLGEMTWFGHVEIHLKSSDWNNHKHQLDDAYNNVILHVVWDHDVEIMTKSGHVLPVLELKNRIPISFVEKCDLLVKSPEEIPCSSLIHKVRSIERFAMIDHVGIMRLKKKAQIILRHLEKNVGDWEATTYQILAKSFGFKTNDHAFLKLSQLINHDLIIKHANNHLSLEALIFGMAGFLEEDIDDYQQRLRHEFDYLVKKHRLSDQSMIRAEWKFLRLRPGNFPPVRLAQFTAFILKNARSFDRFLHYKEVAELRSLFKFEIPEYWRFHYDFAKKSKKEINGIGSDSVNLILINTVVPLLAAYARYTGNKEYMDKAVDLLQNIKPEQNHIIRKWKQLQIEANNAFDTQSLIELRNEFCLKKKCLSCKIGVSLINN